MRSIVAVDEKWGIGKNNGLLFDIKADMRHFVEHTRGKIVVMGANTLLSLPGGMPLKNRINIVLNPEGSDADAEEKGYILVRSLDEVLHTVAGYDSDNVYVIGGAMMYRTLLPYCEEAVVTKVRADGGAQVFYENLDLLPEWELVEESAPVSDSGYTMTFCTYRNRSPLPLDGDKGGDGSKGGADGDNGDDGEPNGASPASGTLSLQLGTVLFCKVSLQICPVPIVKTRAPMLFVYKLVQTLLLSRNCAEKFCLQRRQKFSRP